MKALFIFFMAVGILSVGAADDISFSVIRKTAERSKTRERINATVEKKQIVYTVKVTSRAFRPIEKALISYNIYYETQQFGSTAKAQIQTLAGKTELENLLPGKTVEFDTDPIDLTTATLDGNWYFSSGAGSQSKDKIVGTWIKATDSEGKDLADYRQPSNVDSKRKWQEP